MKELIYAIDLGGTSTKAALFDKATHKLLVKWTFWMGYGNEIIPSFHRELLKTLNEQGWSYEQVKVVSLLVKAPYDAKTGIVPRAVGIGWYNYPVLATCKKTFGNDIPVYIVNDAEGALLGEWKYGTAKKYHTYLYLIIGRGVGSGILLNNQVWLGAHGFAGEIGHGGKLQTKYDCGCDVGTCVEGSSSAYAMERTFTDYVVKNPQVTYLSQLLKKGSKRISMRDLAPYIKSNDPIVMNIFIQCLDPLAQRLALAVMLLDPEAIVIGGGVSALGEYLIKPLLKLMRKYLWKAVFRGRFELKTSSLGNDAGIYGALAKVVQSATDEQ